MSNKHGANAAVPGILRNPARAEGSRKTLQPPEIPHVLPHEKVFPIQIGSELFRLSGASISSDETLRALTKKPRAPSYFSSYFQCQLETTRDGDDSTGVRTLYIDRDPVTFRDISRHLQGYHIQPRDGSHFVKLFADAQFYQLPRLVDQLYEEAIYISIGGIEFQVPRDIFSNPGDSPNYFTLGFAFLFSSPTEVFPGLNRDGLLRPPSIMPPSIPNRSPAIFGELLHLLRGYPLHIRNEEHRAELLKDCRYFLFRGLEQKLIPHHIAFNLSRHRYEITIRLEDIRQPGLSVVSDAASSNQSTIASPQSSTINSPHPPAGHLSGWVNYARQYVDDRPYELVLEIGNEWTSLNPHTLRAEFFGDGRTRISRLFEVVANKLNLPITQPLGLLMVSGGAASQPASPGNSGVSEDAVKIILDGAAVTLDGKSWSGSGGEEDVEMWETESPVGSRPRKRRRFGDGSGAGVDESWTVRTGQWRLKVHSARGRGSGVECVLVAVKLDAFSGDVARNRARTFLGN